MFVCHFWCGFNKDSVQCSRFSVGKDLKVYISGTRGVPASHGGFETCADFLSRYLVTQGYEVSVFCQTESERRRVLNNWFNVERVFLSAPSGAVGTIIFDLRCMAFMFFRRLSGEEFVVITLGYNTAIFNLLLNLLSVPYVVNMDGIEWARPKWGLFAKLWLRFNEYVAARFSPLLIADHPEIEKYLVDNHSVAQKIVTIPYGAVRIDQEALGGEEEWKGIGEYILLVARLEPENSILEIVRAFSESDCRYKLVVVGGMSPDNQYHKLVKASASEDVIFVGAVYEPDRLRALRKLCAYYIHGHTVGGTNPSLVEAMCAQNAIIAHANKYNRWVAGSSATYFDSEIELKGILNELDGAYAKASSKGTFARYEQCFTWPSVLGKYLKIVNLLETKSAVQHE